MKKKTLLKSIYIAINEDGTPGEVQIQRLERWSELPEGAVIPDNYLPVERFGLLTATDDERARLERALGEVAHGHALAALEAQTRYEQESARVGELENQLTDLQMALATTSQAT